VVGDVIPYGMVNNFGGLNGLNIVGLKRRGATRETIHILRGVYRELFHGEGYLRGPPCAGREGACCTCRKSRILAFIRAGEKRPLCVPRAN
jgi:UDP-N-acetylglucosamine acyltransferase